MRRGPLQILMISSLFYPKVAGSVIAVSELMRCLRERGHEVYLITCRLQGAHTPERWENVPVFCVGPSGTSLIHRLLLSLNQACAGVKILKKKEIDVIHAHGSTSLLAGVILGKLFHKPVIVTFHGFPRLWFKGVRWRRESTFALMYPFEKLLINKASGITAQSKILKNILAQLYKVNYKKIQVIPNPTDKELFRYAPHPKPVKPIVLFVGHLARVHGADILIRAAPMVLQAVPKASFLIVGGGPLKDYLKKLIQDLDLEASIFLVGPIFDREKLAKYYAAASVVIIPLRYKGYILSLVCQEAMSTGRPIVTTMTLDPDLKQYGVFMVNFDPRDLARAIKDILLLGEQKYTELALSARKYVEERCSKEVVASLLERLYAQSIKYMK